MTPAQRLAELEERLRALAERWEAAAKSRSNYDAYDDPDMIAAAHAYAGCASELRALLGEAAR